MFNRFQSNWQLEKQVLYRSVIASLLCFFILTSVPAYSQTELTQKQQQTLDRARTLSTKAPDDAIEMAQGVLQSGKTPEAKIWALYTLGGILKDQKKFDDAKSYYLRAYKEALRIENNSFYTVLTLTGLADSQRFTKEFEAAVEAVEKAIEQAKLQKNPTYLISAYKVQGNIYKSSKQYEKSLNSFIQMISIIEKHDLKNLKADAYRKAAAMAEKMNFLEQSIVYGSKAIELMDQPSSKNYIRVARALHELSKKQRKLGSYDGALKHALRSWNLIRSFAAPKLKGQLLLNLTIIYRKLGVYEKSLEYAIELRKNYEADGSPKKLASAYTQIALIYENLKQYESADEFYQKALDTNLEKEDMKYHGSANRGKASILHDNGKYQEALQYAKRAKEIFTELDRMSGVESANRLLGSIYQSLNDNDKALEAFERALIQSRTTNAKADESRSLLKIAQLIADRDPDKSMEYADKGIRIAELSSSRSLMLQGYGVIMELHKKKGHFEEAFYYAKLAKELSDSLNEANFNKIMADLKIVNDVAIKERQIEGLERRSKINDLALKSKTATLELLNKEQAISSLELERGKYIRGLLGSATVIVILILVVGYVRFRHLRKMQLLLRDNSMKMEEKNHKLEESNATKDRLMTVVAHDLRSPMSGLVTLTSMLHEQAGDITTENLLKYTAVLSEQTQQTYALVTDLLEWLMVQVRNSEPVPRNYMLGEIFDDTIKMAQSLAKEKNITITTHLDEKNRVYTDHNMTKIVLRNLLNNSIKFTRRDGEIEIFTDEDEAFITVHVKDNGVGIPPKGIEHIFEVAEKVSTLGTDGEKGTGFGLAVCREFIKKNGGEINVKSVEKKGSDFYFSIPKK